MSTRDFVELTVNGTTYKVGRLALTLNDFLRDVCHLKGTKVLCREGGCGCCVVTASRRDRPDLGEFAVNSCLQPVLACDGWSVTTTEGLGGRTPGFHVIQKRLAEYNGSQCGFCSPGMVMSMHALLANIREDGAKEKENCHGGQVPALFGQTIENALDGNLCRCTGYRAILDAFKSFSTDPPDIEELAKCKGVNGPCDKSCQNDTPTGPIEIHFNDDIVFHKPTNMEEFLTVLEQTRGRKRRFVVGNTLVGVYKNEALYQAYIDTRGVAQLDDTSESLDAGFTVGANVSLSRLITLLEDVAKKEGFKYCARIAKHVGNVANVPVRNVASWAGNLMVKYHHPEFPSDVFVLLCAAGASLALITYGGQINVIPVESLLNADMEHNVIISLFLKPVPKGTTFSSYKITPRSQNAHAYVNTACMIQLDSAGSVTDQPRLVFGGFQDGGPNFKRATQTEEFLKGKKLADNSTIQNALNTLAEEIDSSIESRKAMCLSLFYKTCLSIIGEEASEKVRLGGSEIDRPLMRAERHLVTDESQWPVTQPMPRVTSCLQASGEAEYVNDIQVPPTTLYGAFVISDRGNATLESIDATETLKLAGVRRLITAADVPGSNILYDTSEPAFCDGPVHYAGQAIALLVAESQQIANKAVQLVKVSYKDVATPVTDIREAVAKEMFYKNKKKVVKGDTASAINQSDHVIQGEVTTGAQQHFPIEAQACYAVPTENCLKLYPTSQWVDYTQAGVAHALGINADKVSVEVRRLGGGFGSKITLNNLVSVPCAVAAHLLNAPVKVSLDLNTNMTMLGHRLPYLFRYRVGFSKEGRLSGIEAEYFCDCGYTNSAFTAGDVPGIADNVYSCDNWSMNCRAVKTHTPANTYCRSPAKLQAVYFMETVIEHIAHQLGRDVLEIRLLNLYKQGQITPSGELLSFFRVEEMIHQLQESAQFRARQLEIHDFNKNNRWRKKGLSLVPTRWPAGHSWANYGALVSVFAHDGSVAIAHGGIEMGQGINTKTMQVCARTLGIPMELVSVRPSEDLATANSMATGGSVTSELCCLAVIKACNILLERIKPVREEHPALPWPELIKRCHNKHKINLTTQWMVEKSQCPEGDSSVAYSTFGVTCAEVEVDVLTGMRQVNRLDVLFDVGESLNPLIDVGQIEGALAMSLGFFLMEETRYDLESGRNVTGGTWDYKIAGCKDIPADLRISLLNWAPNPLGLVRTKAVGEPPMQMVSAVLFALKQAIQAARLDRGATENILIDTPLTVEKTFQLCIPDSKSYVL